MSSSIMRISALLVLLSFPIHPEVLNPYKALQTSS